MPFRDKLRHPYRRWACLTGGPSGLVVIRCALAALNSLLCTTMWNDPLQICSTTSFSHASNYNSLSCRSAPPWARPKRRTLKPEVTDLIANDCCAHADFITDWENQRSSGLSVLAAR